MDINFLKNLGLNFGDSLQKEASEDLLVNSKNLLTKIATALNEPESISKNELTHEEIMILKTAAISIEDDE